MAGTYHVQAIASRFPDEVPETRIYKIEKLSENKLKLHVKETRGGKCESHEQTVTVTDDEDNRLSLDGFQIEGKQMPMSLWIAQVRKPYVLLVGCIGADCDESSGFVTIASEMRAVDKLELHTFYDWLTDRCVTPDMFKQLDTHSECGAEWDDRSCKVDQIEGIDEYNEELFVGTWYLVASTTQRYKALKCQIESGQSEFERKTVCTAKMGGEGECESGRVGKVVYSEERKDFTYHLGPYHASFKLIWADPERNQLLFYNCAKTNPDGSCMASRTNVMLFAKQKTITEESLPAEAVVKLWGRGVCVHKDQIHLITDQSECTDPSLF
jgi:hypothetical protein